MRCLLVKQLTVLQFSGSLSLSNSVAQCFALPLLPGMGTFSRSLWPVSPPSLTGAQQMPLNLSPLTAATCEVFTSQWCHCAYVVTHQTSFTLKLKCFSGDQQNEKE